MNIRFLFCFFFSTVSAYTSSDCGADGHEPWLCEYMANHKRNYSGHAEMKLRKSKLKTQLLQQSITDKTFGLTSRSDRFVHENKRNQPLKFQHHKKITRAITNTHIHLASARMPPIDWRQVQGVSFVSPVKDQGECGDCFAFASATVLEFWSAIHRGFPKSLSSQVISDCTSGSGRPDVACDGGLMEYVYEYAKQHPVPLTQDYPYQDKETRCPRKATSYVKVNDYKVLMHDENSNTEHEFEVILHRFGPISVGVDSSNMDNYKQGLFTAEMCSNDIDHAVTIVGYTEEAWIIKNSWGEDWGQDGYLYLERGKNACGIAEYAVYVDSAEPIRRNLRTEWYMDP